MNIFGRSGVGKSWFAGKTLEDVLGVGSPDEPVDADGESRCDCDEPDCDHEPLDPDYVPSVGIGGGGDDKDAEVPAFGSGEDAFDYAVHIDVEDEERGFSNTENPLLLTYHATKENIRRAVKFAEDPPDYIPERELEDGPVVYLPSWVLYKNRYIRVVPEGLTDDELKVLVEMLADAAMKAGDCHFSLDEAHLVAKTHNIGDKLMRLATGGRKRGVEWLFITQRPQKMHEDLLSQSDYTIYFELRDRDRDKAAEKSEAVPNAEERLESLGKRNAIIEDFDNGEWVQFSTEDLDRSIPHVSGDDGKANRVYESLIADTEMPGDTTADDA